MSKAKPPKDGEKPQPPAPDQQTPPAADQQTPPAAAAQQDDNPNGATPLPPEASLGRIVHYVVKEGQVPGTKRAAIITAVHGPYLVNLTVFPDQANPSLYEERDAASSPYDDSGKPGTWSWPPRV